MALRSRWFTPMCLGLSVESFRPGGRNDMKEKHTGKTSVEDGSDGKRVRSLSDRQIRRAIESDPEARRTDKEFWKKAAVAIQKANQLIPIGLVTDLFER